jgi:hypothetical protein
VERPGFRPTPLIVVVGSRGGHSPAISARAKAMVA